MKINFICFMACYGIWCWGQSPPIWTFHFPKSVYIDADLLSNGNPFSIWASTDTNSANCSSTCTHIISLDDMGNQNWEKYYDTANGCVYDNPINCSIISGPSSPTFAISVQKNYINPDSFMVIDYAGNGSIAYSKYVGSVRNVVGNMGDGHCYVSQYKPLLVKKMDSNGNSIWAFLGPDSNNVTANYFGKNNKKILLASEDYSFSTTDDMTRIIGTDTTGAQNFNFSYNLLSGANETAVKIWYSTTKKIVGVSYSPAIGRIAFGMDTTGNLLWQTQPFSAYKDATYDPRFNVLHVLANGSSTIKECYKIDCTNGFILDSISLDSISPGNIVAKVAVDTSGNLFVGYENVPASFPTFTVERYSPNYWFDWKGTATEPSCLNWSFGDMKVSDSSNVYFFYSTNLHSSICKFSPPLISSTNEISNREFLFRLFPNPSNFSFTIHTTENYFATKNSEIQIITVAGEVFKTISLPANQKSISISTEDFPSGMYFVQLIQEGIPTETKKLIIQH